MKSFYDIELGMLVNTNKGEARIIGVSENFRGEVELDVQVIEGKEEFFIMQSEITYID